jgi:hypothetical protein
MKDHSNKLEELKKILNEGEGVDVLREYFRLVAAGEAPPLIRENNAVLAAQAMVILIDHARSESYSLDLGKVEDLEITAYPESGINGEYKLLVTYRRPDEN